MDRLIKPAIIVGFALCCAAGVWTAGVPRDRPEPIRPVARRLPAVTTHHTAIPRKPAARPPVPVAGRAEAIAAGRPEDPPARRPHERERPQKPSRAEHVSAPARRPAERVAHRHPRPARALQAPVTLKAPATRKTSKTPKTSGARSDGRGHAPAMRRGAATGPAGTAAPAPTARDRLSADQACDTFASGDWRRSYCLSAWDAYVKKLGLQ